MMERDFSLNIHDMTSIFALFPLLCVSICEVLWKKTPKFGKATSLTSNVVEGAAPFACILLRNSEFPLK
jgi:hypothetical protein